MRGALAGLCMLLCGCDTVFMLDRFDAPIVPDAPVPPITPLINDPTGDADFDGQPNATDLCPLIASNVVGADTDEDGDKVGNLCDPNPEISGDCLGLFDVFQDAGGLSSHWLQEGEPITKSPGQMIIPPGQETIVYLDVDLALTSLTVGGYIPGGSGGRRAIQLLFDHRRVTGVTGLACSVEYDDQGGDPSTVALVDVVDGVDRRLLSSPLDVTPVGAGTTVELGWNDRHAESGVSYAGRCRAELADQSTQTVKTDVVAMPPQGRAFGLRTQIVGFNVSYILGYGRNCVAP